MKHKNVFLAGYFFLLSLFGFQLDVHSQPKDDWQAGSAYQLCGKTSTLYCFIETADNPWTEAEKEASLSALQQAQNWLMHQAGKWHVSLTFQNHALTSEAIVVPTIAEGTGSGKERVDWVHQLVNDLGYSNTKSAYRKLRRKYGNKNLQLIIFARANGTSYAMRFANGMRKKKFFFSKEFFYTSNIPVVQQCLQQLFLRTSYYICMAPGIYIPLMPKQLTATPKPLNTIQMTSCCALILGLKTCKLIN